MMTRRLTACLLCGLFPALSPAAEDSPAALAARIDRLLEARQAKAGVRPAPLADDATFLRRVYLDVGGRVPSVSEVRDFLSDRRPDKRRRVVERLLRGPLYVRNFTNFWRAQWLPELNADEQNPFLRQSFEDWLRVRLTQNVGYDRLVREILTFGPVVGPRGEIVLTARNRMRGPNPAAFDFAQENKPEKLAAASSRMFLGIRLECAQCHDHPFATWSREQFWELTAFFTPRPPTGAAPTAAIPNTRKVVQARFPDGTRPAWGKGRVPRTVLADWATTPNNPFFARAAVNRVWEHFFGYGLIEPVDDLGREGARDELLDELARAFAEHHFDLPFLIRAITASRAYQCSSESAPARPGQRRLFTHMTTRALTPEQIFDSLVQAAGDPSGRPAARRALRAEFLARFANRAEKQAEAHTSVLQALALMNGRYVRDATSLDHSTVLAAVADAPFLDTAGRIEALYLAALGRPPRQAELSRLVRYVDKGGPSGVPRRALADVFWALLNSSEFLFNH